jgi:SAM-dependent methyltransferase
LLCAWAERLPRGRALDIACGAGRNALFLAEQGYEVDAMDISATALARGEASARERGLRVNWIESDLDFTDLPSAPYDVIVMCRYVNRELFPRVKEALAEGGHLVYEHHLVASRHVNGPSTNQYRLRPNELLHLFLDLRVLHYEEGLVCERDDRIMALAQLVACRGSPGF